VARVDVEMTLAICVPCKKATQVFTNPKPFCQNCGIRLIAGTLLLELDYSPGARVVQRVLFIPRPEEGAEASSGSDTPTSSPAPARRRRSAPAP